MLAYASHSTRTSVVTLALTLIFLPIASWAVESPEDSASTSRQVSYSAQIKPIFQRHCQGCHQPAKAQGDYQMTVFADLLAAGESGQPGIVPGSPDESYLFEQISIVDGHAEMPKDGTPLHEAEIDLIRKWIVEGAIDDSPASVESYSLENPPKYQRAPLVTSLAYSPDGKWLATTGFQEVLLINTDTWKTEKRFVGLSHRIESVCFSPDSSLLGVTGGIPGSFGEVQIWDVASSTLQTSFQVTSDTLFGGNFSNDGSLFSFGATDNVVRAINTQNGNQELQQGAHEDWVLTTVFNPSATHVLSAGRDMTVKLTEVATERFVDNVTSITPGALRGGINTLAMHPTRDEVLVGGADGLPKAYRIFRQTERKIGDDANLIREFPAADGRIFAIDIANDGSQFAVASTLDGTSRVQVYPYEFDGTISPELKAALAKRVAQRSADERKLIADSRISTQSSLVDFELADSRLYAMSFSPSGSELAFGGSDGIIRIFDIAASEIQLELCPVAISESVPSESKSLAATVAGAGISDPYLSVANESTIEPETLASSNPSLDTLEISPSKVQLAKPNQYTQFVVTATFKDGSQRDVTAMCNWQAPEGWQISPNGFLRMDATNRAPQRTQMVVRFQDASLEVSLDLKSDAPSELADGKPDFIRDINPILSRLGCNAGTCHGAQAGKNGFKLSLRGYDPVEDLRALSDDLRSRRLNAAMPDESLMLQKPIGTVPHEGGVLLTADSAYYATLRKWIAGGATLDVKPPKVQRIEVIPAKPVLRDADSSQQFRVVAHYPDGSQQDVTHEAFVESGDAEIVKAFPGARVQAVRRGEAPVLVRYEGAYAAATVTVMGERDGFEWQPPEVFNQVDELVAKKWEQMKLLPSDVIEDHEFLRRVQLDLTGLPPTAQEVREFLADRRPSLLKRIAKIDALIGSDDYVEHWTNKWSDLLQVNSKFLGSEGAADFRNWVRESVKRNQPYDEFARDILTAEGSNQANPAASYYKILREPDLIMENTTHLFLAIRFNCNKCHDHPFERWTQDQYYQLAAFFSQTGIKKDPASGDRRIGGSAVEGAKPLFEIVFDRSEGEMLHGRTGQQVAPEFPFTCDYTIPENATRRERLANWITSPSNPYFARSMVNRLWGYLMGTGLIEPLDDIRAGNPPTNPELLDYLTHEFVKSEFNVQHVLRLICNSRTYQLSVATHQWNSDDKKNYSHAKAKRLPAEVLYDAIHRVTGAVSAIPGVQPGTRAAALPDVAAELPDGFLTNLGRPVRESACECERTQDLQLGPVMALISGPTVGQAISDPECALPELAENELSDEELVREIYWRVLNRDASDVEIETAKHLAVQIEQDHASLQKELAARETWWAEEFKRREMERESQLQFTKDAIAQREQAIATQRKQQEAERSQRIEQATTELANYRKNFPQLATKFLEERQNETEWFPLSARSVAATDGFQLVPQSDRSIIASGVADKGTYTIDFETTLQRLSGFRLEALPKPDIAGGGPGLPGNGNFVISEIEVSAWPKGSPDLAMPVAISEGAADFSQASFGPEQIFDGKKDGSGGWAVHPQGGVVHWATFQFAQPIQTTDDRPLIMRFVIAQNHNAANHLLARFRLSVSKETAAAHTDSADNAAANSVASNSNSPEQPENTDRPADAEKAEKSAGASKLQLGLPEAFAAIQSQAPDQRTEESQQTLFAYLEKNDTQYLALQQALATANQPVPPDPMLVELNARATQLAETTPDDPKLVQLRLDVQNSQSQVDNLRLTMAQDLTWALINSPAFLFNH